MKPGARGGRGCMALVLLAALWGAAWAQSSALSAEELYDRLAPSVWMVETRHGGDQGSIGSAVVVAPEALITNCHVLEQARSIVVRHDRQVFRAQLQYRDPERDLCQLRAPGVAAPAVEVVDWRSLRIGATLYAIGNPRGLELTLSDGLLSGIRRDAAGAIDAIQISVPISPGSSGGGLFDNRGRLVGITTAGLRDSQNLNFALPATWIAELAQRAAIGAAFRPAPAAPPAAAAPGPSPAPAPAQATAGWNVFEYRLRDRLTGLTRRVIYRVDRREGDRLVVNGGSRLEDATGRVLADTGLVGGEFDQAMPPGGWIHGDNMRQPAWSSDYRSAGDGRPYAMQLQAQALGEEILLLQGREIRSLRFRFTGYTTRGGGATTNPPGRYQATAWYAPDLARVVRFEARSRGGLGHTAFVVDEVLELVDARSE